MTSAGARLTPWPGLGARRGTGSWLPFALAAAAGLLATVAVPLLPLQFAYPAPSLHIAVETGAALTGLLATAIVVGGWYDGPRLDRLAIAAGLSLIAVTSAVLTALLAISPGAGPRGTIGLTGMLVGSALLAAGAFAPPRRPASPRSAVVATVLLTVAASAATIGPVALVPAAWPGETPAAVDMARPMLDQPLARVLLQLAIVACFAVAAVGLTRRSVRSGDAFAGRVGLAIVFLAFAMVHYVLFPPVAHDWLHAGDVLRLLSCGVLLWAAAGEIATVVAARAAARERRRIARDLHDGVAQELAFIRRRAARLAGADEIAVAAERALLDSRKAIERLARPPDEPLERALARHAAVVGSRTGVAVSFTASGAVSAGPEVSEALARILGEAVTNARHGNATRVHVELSADPLRLRVVDDGTGFDPSESSSGFGLGGMRERAALVGAELIVRSDLGAGTEVAVELR